MRPTTPKDIKNRQTQDAIDRLRNLPTEKLKPKLKRMAFQTLSHTFISSDQRTFDRVSKDLLTTAMIAGLNTSDVDEIADDISAFTDPNRIDELPKILRKYFEMGNDDENSHAEG